MSNNNILPEQSFSPLTALSDLSVVTQSAPHSLLSNLIKNIMANISLAAEMFEETTSDSDSKMYLNIITRNSRRLQRLAEKIEIYNNTNVEEEISIYQAIDDIVRNSAGEIEKKKIAVIRKYVSGPFDLPFKGSKIKIALENIIENAIEAMPSANGRLTISGNFIGDIPLLDIEDNGCGIEGSRLKYLFTSFSSNKYRGTGIGLAETYGILTENEITVSVQSEPGRGTRFALLFSPSLFF